MKYLHLAFNKLMVEHPELHAKIMPYRDYDENQKIECPLCHWKGRGKDGDLECHDVLMDVSCPECEKMLLVLDFPDAAKDLASRMQRED